MELDIVMIKLKFQLDLLSGINPYITECTVKRWVQLQVDHWGNVFEGICLARTVMLRFLPTTNFPPHPMSFCHDITAWTPRTMD